MNPADEPWLLGDPIPEELTQEELQVAMRVIPDGLTYTEMLGTRNIGKETPHGSTPATRGNAEGYPQGNGEAFHRGSSR